jgi:hypothetical protein
MSKLTNPGMKSFSQLDKPTIFMNQSTDYKNPNVVNPKNDFMSKLDVNTLLNNKMLLPLVSVAITLYSVMIVPKLNMPNYQLLDNMLFKLALVALVYYVSTINKTYGIVLSIGILFTVFGIKSKYRHTPSLTPSHIPSETPSHIPSETPSLIPSETPSTMTLQIPSLMPNVDTNISLSPRSSEIIKESLQEIEHFKTKCGESNVVANSDDTIIHEHIIDSVLNEKTHLTHLTQQPDNEYHKKNAYLYKLKLDSLLATNKIRNMLKQHNDNYEESILNNLLLLLNHENNKIDLITKILSAQDDGMQTSDNDKAIEHFENMNNYEIELAEKLRLDNMEHIKKYYSEADSNNRQSNEYENVESVMDNYNISPYDSTM